MMTRRLPHPPRALLGGKPRPRPDDGGHADEVAA